jgi:hypothetical protein
MKAKEIMGALIIVVSLYLGTIWFFGFINMLGASMTCDNHKNVYVINPWSLGTNGECKVSNPTGGLNE